MIQDLVNDIFKYVDTKELDVVYLFNSNITEGIKPHSHNYCLAEFLHSKNYCKIPEGSVVIDKEYLKKELQGLEAHTRKETAREILIYLAQSGVINTAPDTIKMYFKETYGVEYEI